MMKEIWNRLDKDTKLGGIFGIIAIAAIIAEMALGAFTATAIVGGIKDIASTVVAVLVFIFAIRQFKKNSVKGFDAVFADEMDKIINKYSPVLNRNEKENGTYAGTFRYNIATKLTSISGSESGAYHLFFRVNSRQVSTIAFKITKTVFGERKELVSARVQRKIEKLFSESVTDVTVSSDEVRVTFREELKNDEDAVMLAQLVDCVLLICIVEYGPDKKQ